MASPGVKQSVRTFRDCESYLYRVYLFCNQLNNKKIIICSFCTARLTTQWVLKASLCDSSSTHIPRAAKQACTHNERPETMDQKYGRIPIFRRRRKLEKTYQGRYGIGKPNSLNHHWLAALVKGKCTSTKPTCLTTVVVCHPGTEQNRPKNPLPGPAENWTGDLLHQSESSTSVLHYSNLRNSSM